MLSLITDVILRRHLGETFAEIPEHLFVDDEYMPDAMVVVFD